MKVITTNRLNRFWKNGVKPIKDALANKLNTSSIVNNLLTTAAGYALDARQGKALDDKITALNGKLPGTGIGDGVALIDKSSYTFPRDGYLVAKASYRPNYFVEFKIVGTNGKTTNAIQIGSNNNATANVNTQTNNCVALYVKKGMGINSIAKNSNQYNVIQFYPLI